jgi:hypothetical protein
MALCHSPPEEHVSAGGRQLQSAEETLIPGVNFEDSTPAVAIVLQQRYTVLPIASN